MQTRILRAAMAACALLAAAANAVAQSPYPSRPIRVVLPFVAGGGSDFVARALGQKLEAALGQPIVMDYRAGGGGMIASDITAHAAPDGYTVYLAGTTFTSQPALHKTLPFDPLNDFAPISRVSDTPAVLVVHPALPAKSVKDLLTLAKARPGELTYGSAGIGSASHLAGEQFKLLAGINLLHVPFKGSSQVSTSLLGGETFVALVNPISLMPNIRAARLRALAVTTKERSLLLPDLPTIAEAGVPGYENTIWTGLIAPARTPPPVLLRLSEEVRKALLSPEVTKILAGNGARASPTTPDQFRAYIKSEIEKTAHIFKAAGIEPR
jgi:tripartite-type tricarboxylate transporter receptor subunit TctC